MRSKAVPGPILLALYKLRSKGLKETRRENEMVEVLLEPLPSSENDLVPSTSGLHPTWEMLLSIKISAPFLRPDFEQVK